MRTQPAMIERSAPQAHMSPLYARAEDESYRVLEGELTFFVGDRAIRAGRGDVVAAPRGVARAGRAESAGARWLVMTRVASLDRFLDFGRAVSRPSPAPEAGWASPEEESSLSAIAAANEIELLGPPERCLPGAARWSAA